MSPVPPITTVFIIVSLIFDLGISSQPVALAKIEHPMVLDASKQRRGMVIREQKHDDSFVHPAAVLKKLEASTPRLFFAAPLLACGGYEDPQEQIGHVRCAMWAPHRPVVEK
jgi:hypothetical protein